MILWLKTVSDHEHENSLLGLTVRSATAWCDGYTVPLLVPLTGWLPVPLPSQIRCITIPGSSPVRCIEVSPSKQHLILSQKNGDPQMWHIMSNTLVHTFKGEFFYYWMNLCNFYSILYRSQQVCNVYEGSRAVFDYSFRRHICYCVGHTNISNKS